MFSHPPRPDSLSQKPSFAVLQQAANWYAEVQNVSSPHHYPEALQSWLDESLEHQQAWQYVLNISQRFMPLRENDGQKSAALTALSQLPEDAGRRQMLKMAAFISVGSLLGWAGLRHTPLGEQMLAWRADYYSPRGAITAFRLQDGSRIWLDTDSALDADYTPERRALSLLYGRVLIETATSPERPLTLSTPQGLMLALGTRFSAQLFSDRTELQVYQGAVEVSPLASSDKLILNAGQMTTFKRNGIGSVTGIITEPGWPQGLLQVDNLPLSVFIERLSAYRRGYLGCSPAVASLTVTGTFPLHDTDMALNMLTNVLPVQLNRHFSWWLTVAPRNV